MADIATIQDINNIKEELIREIKSLREEVSTIKRKKKWLKAVEFMEFYGIKAHSTLRKYREANQVKAVMKLSEWYYDADSFLPS